MTDISNGKVVQQKKVMCINTPECAEVYSLGTKFLENKDKTTLI